MNKNLKCMFSADQRHPLGKIKKLNIFFCWLVLPISVFFFLQIEKCPVLIIYFFELKKKSGTYIFLLSNDKRFIFVCLFVVFFSQHENKTIEITIELSYFFFLVRALNRKLSVFLVLKRKYIWIKNHNFRTRYHRNLIIISFRSQENS